MSNIFEDYQAKKKYIIELTNEAIKYEWISKERADEIIKKIENDVLTIGVIGQVKCGKSTFLNSFVFGDDVLPAASTPMTAALSVITYGETKKIVAEFYTKEEWDEQKITAGRDLSEVEGNEAESEKIKAAQELVEKSNKIGNKIDSLLGKTQEDSFENLIEYVGADGKYISITKAVKIFYPKEYLRGVEIVDTPGFNDPIVSREERTKEFLNKADVVVMMLYAEQPFNSVDRTILFENVRQCGIGKVLIGINKYDIPYATGKDETEIKDYVKKEILKACTEYQDDTIADIMKETEPVILSASMALLSEISMSKIENNQDYTFYWKNYCKDFEINNQKQFREKSHIDELTQEVLNLIENEKGNILFTKPKNEILAAGANKEADIKKKILDCQNELNVLKTPDDELDEKLDNLLRVEKRLNKKLEKMDYNLEEVLEERLPKLNRSLKAEFERACDQMNRKVDEWKRSEKLEILRLQLDKIIRVVLSRDIPREVENETFKIKQQFRDEISTYFLDMSKEVEKYDSEFDRDCYFDSLQTKIKLSVDKEINSYGIENIFSKEGDFWSSLSFRRAKDKEAIIDKLTIIQTEFNPENYVKFIRDKKNLIVENIKTETIGEIIDPIKNTINKCKDEKDEKAKLIISLEEKNKQMDIEKNKIAEQIKSIKAL